MTKTLCLHFNSVHVKTTKTVINEDSPGQNKVFFSDPLENRRQNLSLVGL